ncbi:MAG TPA: GNAT family N-acetyltransferase [Acidimicrobiales bacterium]
MERSGPIAIVEAGPESARAVAGVRLDFLSEHRRRELGHGGGFAAANRRWVDEGLRAGWYRAWLAETDGVVVGGAGLLVNRMPPLPEDERTAEAWVIAMWVRPDHRRRGLATGLLDRCRTAAREAGIRRLLLWATADGLPLYEHEGFTSPDRLLHLPVPE